MSAAKKEKLPMPIKVQLLEAQKKIAEGDMRGAEQRLTHALAMGVAHDAKSEYLVTIHSKVPTCALGSLHGYCPTPILPALRAVDSRRDGT